jgi:hypothetical protein
LISIIHSIHRAQRNKNYFDDYAQLLGCQDSNLGVAAPKAAALPLGYTPRGNKLYAKKINSMKELRVKNISNNRVEVKQENPKILHFTFHLDIF